MGQLTIHLADDRGFVNPASVRFAFYKVVFLLLDAKGEDYRVRRDRETYYALRDVLKSVVKKAVRLVGKFEVQLAADSACFSIYSEQGETAGNRASEEFRDAFSKTEVEYHYEWRNYWQQKRPRGRFVIASMEDTFREERARPARRFHDTQIKDVKKLADDAGDRDAKDTMKQFAEGWQVTAAQIGHHFATWGIAETYRRCGLSYPSGALLAADEAAPVDEASA